MPVLGDAKAENVVEASGLVKKFGNVVAVDGVDIAIRNGEIFGFLGPNGAGKTTTVRMLTTLLKPDAGTVSIGGHDISKHPIEAKRLIGISQQHISLDKDISVYENLMYKAMLQGIPKQMASARINELSHRLGLEPYMNRIVNDLSGGWKRKAAIVSALVHRPAVLFLDEPTAGLDTQSRHVLWDLIRELNKDGATIILTTHYIEEAECLCNRISMIHKGKIKLTGTPDELCRKFGRWTVEYIEEAGRRGYRYYHKKEDADDFIISYGSLERTMLRRTHLEDVYLEVTGRETGTED